MTADLSTVAPLQWLGIAGAMTYIANYTLLTLRILSPDTVTYFASNLVAAALVLASLGDAFNHATLMIQVFFLGVSLCGILTRLPPDRRARLRPDPASLLGRGVQTFRT